MLKPEHLGELARVVENSKSGITKVILPTGTGKTQIVPPFLARHFGRRIFVAVPTREAARTNYLNVKKTAENKDLKIGYSAGGKVEYDADTMVIYATSGHIEGLLMRDFESGVPKYQSDYILMIDEYHTQTVDNTIILGLWKLMRQFNVNAPALILTSATETDISGITNLASRFVMEITTPYKIEPRNYPTALRGEVLYNKMIDIAINETKKKGHVLLFVPSIQIADDMADKIRSLTKAKTIAYHSRTSEADEKEIFNKSDQRKYIVATNVAETSITIPGVAWVIDSMLEKVAEESFNGGKRLVERRITMMSSTQRRGRTGRTNDGVYYSMLPKNIELVKELPPEYKRLPIYNECLKLLTSGISPRDIFTDISSEKLTKIYNFMEKYSAIPHDRSSITTFGVFAGIINLSIPVASFLWFWHLSGGESYWGAVIAAIVDTDLSKLFIIPGRIRNPGGKVERGGVDRKTAGKIGSNTTSAEYNNYIKEHYAVFYAPDQLSLVLNIWLSLETEVMGSLKKKLSHKEVKKWAENKKLDVGTLVSIAESLVRILSGLQRVQSLIYVFKEFADLNIDVTKMTHVSVVNLMEKSTGIFSTIFNDRIMKPKNGVYTDGMKTYSVSNYIPTRLDNKNNIIALDEINLPGSKFQYIISLAIYETFMIEKYKQPELPAKPKVKVTNVSPPDWFMPKYSGVEDDLFFLDFKDISPEDIGFSSIEIPQAMSPQYLIGMQITKINRPKTYYPTPIIPVYQNLMFKPQPKVSDDFQRILREQELYRTQLEIIKVDKTKALPVKQTTLKDYQEQRIPFSLTEYRIENPEEDIIKAIEMYTFD